MSHAIADDITKLNELKYLAQGLPVYFKRLFLNDDDIVATGAAYILLNNGAIDDEDAPQILSLAQKSSQIRQIAFNFCMSTGRIKFAKQIVELAPNPTSDLIARHISATYRDDLETLLEIEKERYRQSCDLQYLERFVSAAEAAHGYQSAVPILVQATLIDPKNSNWPFQLGQHLYSANLPDLLDQLCTTFDEIEIYPNLSNLFRALLLNQRKEPDRALSMLKSIDTNKLPKGAQNLYLTTMASSLENLGEFERAYDTYAEMNSKLKTADYAAGGFIRHVSQSLRLEYDTRDNDDYDDGIVQLLGFPRSGTTLLENMLDCHPQIETFEEITSLASVRMMLNRRAETSTFIPREFIAEARETYVLDVMRQKKSDAKILLDKMPISTANARLFKFMFPNKRFIFSIRHPYDVVLSCFKQSFTPNLAMDSFTTFEDACATYDFVMNQWFTNFTIENPNVCYVRYDDLVTSMRPTMERVFSFLGTEWVDEVNEFAKKAEARQVKTPSYLKVRQGLSIGVQSSWKNYHFLFEKPEARVLDKWVNIFGYSTN